MSKPAVVRGLALAAPAGLRAISAHRKMSAYPHLVKWLGIEERADRITWTSLVDEHE